MLSTKKVVLSSLLLLSLILVNEANKLTYSKDDSPSLEYTQSLAVTGVASAQYSLGLMYHFGQGVTQDYKQALRWYTKSAIQQNMMSQFSLGLMYAKGQGTQDYKQAVYWFKKAAYLKFPIQVSDYIEKNANEEQRKEGLDIADFL
jgi:TPR repeat protein